MCVFFKKGCLNQCFMNMVGLQIIPFIPLLCPGQFGPILIIERVYVAWIFVFIGKKKPVDFTRNLNVNCFEKR